VYAIGAMLYHLLSGKTPHSGSSSDEVLAAVLREAPASLTANVPGVPRDLVAIVDKAMARQAADRYPSARELADELRQFTTGRLGGAHGCSSRELLWRWLRRHRFAVAAIAVAAAISSVVAIVALRNVVEARDRAEGARRAADSARTTAERARADAVRRADAF